VRSTRWPLRPVGKCAKFLSGGTPSKARPEFWEGDIPWVSSGEMTELRIHDTPLHISEDGAREGSRLVAENTVLAVVRGMSLAKEFRVAITKREMAFNQDLKAFACEPDVDPEFLFYALLARRAHIRDLSTDASHGTKRLETDVLSAFEIPVPTTMDIQRRVVSLLSAYDDLIENNRRRMALLEEAARQLYREWFIRLRFPGHEHTRIVKGVPEGWRKKRLSDIAEVNRESLSGGYDGEIEYIDISAVMPGSINETTIYDFRDAPSRARRVVRHGDIIWSCVRPNRRSYAVIWQPAPNLIASTGFAVLSPLSVPTTFLLQATTTDNFVGYLENHARGAAYPAVVTGDFERAEILIPWPTLVEAFNDQTEPLLSQAHTLRLQNVRLRSARDLLLPRLMSGEIAV
jgi:type I restriction enzyme, S subunit